MVYEPKNSAGLGDFFGTSTTEGKIDLGITLVLNTAISILLRNPYVITYQLVYSSS